MKMVMAVVPRDEAGRVIDALTTAGYTATFTESRGGMLRQAQYTLFIAVENDALAPVLSIIKKSCHSHITVEPEKAGEPQPFVSGGRGTVTASVGGAVVFVWDLELFTIY